MAKRLILFALAVVCVISCVVLPIAAEFVPADYVEYPTMNAFPYPYEPQTGFMANYITYPEKQVYFSGTPQGGFEQVRSAFILRDWQTGLNTTQTVTFSCDPASTVGDTVRRNVDLRIQIVSSVGGATYYDVSVWNGRVSFDMSPTDKMNVYLRFEANVTISSFAFYPVLNYGNTAYPYQPYMNTVLDDAFSAGEGFGYENGYTEGVVDGIQQAQDFLTASIYLDCTVDVNLYYDGEFYQTVTNVPYEITAMGLSFRNTFNYLDDEYASPSWNEVSLRVNLAKKMVYQLNPIVLHVPYAGDSVDVEGTICITDQENSVPTANDVYIASALGSEGSFTDFTVVNGAPSANPGYVRWFDFYVGDYEYLNNTTVATRYSNYNEGYLEGYKQGLSFNNQNQYDKGFADGEKVGYADGKKEGLQAAEDGGWLSLFSAVVEAPVHAFQSLFNFELFGFDMRMMISSVLTISMFILILKKIGVI